MNMKSQICEALCQGFRVHDVPIGLSITSPLDWLSGDKLTFYARVDGSRVRFEDSGDTLFELEGAGVDLSSASRMEILETLSRSHRVIFDEENAIFHSEWVENESAGITAVKFLSFMHRVQDLTLFSRGRVANTFREDLISAIELRFRAEAEVVIGEAPIENLAFYIVDIVVKHRNGRMAAIFPCTSEQKALEAVLFSKEIELKKISNVVPFLIFEHATATNISKTTTSKAMNSELQLGSWDGGSIEVLDKVGRHVSAAN